MPNAFGGYDETAESMGKYIQEWCNNNYLNIVGGCCGTTPEHIKQMKNIVENLEPRSVKKLDNINKMKLSGLEAFNI